MSSTRRQETSPLSRHQSRCVDGHEQVWRDRLASLTFRTVQPMRSPLTRAHPSQPQFPCSCRLAPGSGFRHCDGYHTRRRSPPCRFSDRQGSWFEPTWRDGGVEPSTPSWSSSRTDGGRSTTPSAVGRCAAAFPRPSRPASHIHNHPSACPARIYLPPIVTTSHSALLARW